MKRFLTCVLASTVALTAAIPAQAASTPASPFNVTATLTSKCEVTSAPTDVAFTYTSFQATAATATGGAFSVRCTNTLPYTLALDAASGTVIGLAYTLTLSAPGGTGSGSAVAFTVNGSMISGQSGTCAVSATNCTGTSARTLTVNY